MVGLDRLESTFWNWARPARFDWIASSESGESLVGPGSERLISGILTLVTTGNVITNKQQCNIMKIILYILL